MEFAGESFIEKPDLDSKSVQNVPDGIEAPGRLDVLGRGAWRTAGCLLLGIAPGAIEGAASTVSAPVHMEIVNGIGVSVAPAHGEITDIELEPLKQYELVDQIPKSIITAYLPHKNILGTGGVIYDQNMHLKIPVLGDVGARIKLTNINGAQLDSASLAAAFDHPKKLIEDPVKSALIRQVEDNAMEWGIFGGYIELTAQEIAALGIRRLLDKIRDPDVARRYRHRVLAGIGSACATLVVAAGYGAANEYTASTVTVPGNTRPFSPYIAGQVPMLTGATVSNNSPLAYLQADISRVLQKKYQIDTFFSHASRQARRDLLLWKTNPANAALLKNPLYTPVLSEAGLHCSFPTGEKIAPVFAAALKPLVIINTGNVQVSDGTLPFESYCVNLLLPTIQAAVKATGQKVYVVTSLGTHDAVNTTGRTEQALLAEGPDHKPYHAVKVLGVGNDGLVTVHGLTFDGVPTPVRNVYNVLPSVNGHAVTPLQENEAFYKAGRSVAKTCSQEYHTKYVRPFLVENSREIGYQALLSGCAAELVDGEGPGGSFVYTPPPGALSTVNSYVISERSSAGNGDNCVFWPYQMPYGGMQYLYFLVNAKTNRIAYEATFEITDQGQLQASNLTPIKAPDTGRHSLVVG